jgi:hypothetical protein
VAWEGLIWPFFFDARMLFGRDHENGSRFAGKT